LILPFSEVDDSKRNVTSLGWSCSVYDIREQSSLFLYTTRRQCYRGNIWSSTDTLQGELLCHRKLVLHMSEHFLKV